jgi:hypothetical protein
VIFEAGGSGCVIAYNFATNEYSSPDPDFLALDFGTHGAHPYLNLFEGNVFAKWTLDWSHGSASHNVLFRSCVTGVTATARYGLYWVDIEAHNYFNSVVGCVMAPGIPDALFYSDNITGRTHLVCRLGYNTPGSAGRPTDATVATTTFWHGNWDPVHGSAVWDANNPDHNLPASLYLAARPAWWKDSPWPAIGPDLNPIISKIPAQKRFETSVMRN